MNKLQAKAQVEIVKDTIEKSKEELEKLQIIIDKPERLVWRPEKVGDEYWSIDNHEPMISAHLTNEEPNSIDDKRFSIGNCYKTERQALAVVALRKHIYKFPEPEKTEANSYRLCVYPRVEWRLKNLNINKEGLWNRLISYHAGIIMDVSTSEEDRAERLKLLEAVYNID